MSFALAKYHQRMRNKPETARHGKKWISEEDDELLNLLTNKSEIKLDKMNEIAKKFKRTKGAIESRFLLHATNMIRNKEKTLKEVSNILGIHENIIQDFIDKNNQKLKLKEEKERIRERKELITNYFTNEENFNKLHYIMNNFDKIKSMIEIWECNDPEKIDK